MNRSQVIHLQPDFVKIDNIFCYFLEIEWLQYAYKRRLGYRKMQ